MALFQNSILTVLQAQQIVADSANASGDATMLARASKALDMATNRWNNTRLWHFLLTTHTDIQVVAAITVSGCTVTDGSATVATTSNPTTLGVLAEDIVSLTGFPPNTTVLSATATSFVVSIPANLAVSPLTSAVATVFRSDYTLPSNFMHMYDAQLLSNSTILRRAEQRQYTRVDPVQTPSLPSHYGLFTQGGTGKIRLFPPPTAEDALRIRFYRRMAVPSVIGTAGTLDIVRDFEYGVIALAKYYFLLDKGGPQERMLGWLTEGERILNVAAAKEQMYSDGSMAFVPDNTSGLPVNPNDVSPYLDY